MNFRQAFGLWVISGAIAIFWMLVISFFMGCTPPGRQIDLTPLLLLNYMAQQRDAVQRPNYEFRQSTICSVTAPGQVTCF